MKNYYMVKSDRINSLTDIPTSESKPGHLPIFPFYLNKRLPSINATLFTLMWCLFGLVLKLAELSHDGQNAQIFSHLCGLILSVEFHGILENTVSYFAASHVSSTFMNNT